MLVVPGQLGVMEDTVIMMVIVTLVKTLEHLVELVALVPELPAGLLLLGRVPVLQAARGEDAHNVPGH